MPNQWTGAQVAEHNSPESCWVIVHGNVYDVTEFLPGEHPFWLLVGPRYLTKIEHPGGTKVILKYAGKDATEEFDPIHPPDTLQKYLPSSKHLGSVDMSTVATSEKEIDPDEEERQVQIRHMPLLEQCYNLFDFESIARRVMKKTAWAYYSSGVDDEIVRLPEQDSYYTVATNNTRQCARTIRLTTRYSSGLAFWWMSRTSIHRRQCWELTCQHLSM